MTISKQKNNALNNSDELQHSKETSHQNLITFSSSTEPHALELNRRLKTFEQTISTIEKKLTTSHNSFRQSIADLSKKSASSASYIGLSQTQLRSLDDSYRSLSLQSDILTKKTSSLATLFERSDKKQSESFKFIDNKFIENNNLLNIQIRKIQSDLSVLDNNLQQVERQSEQLLTNINKLTQNLQNSTQIQNLKIQSVEKNLEAKATFLENQVKQIINGQSNDLEQLKSTITENENKLNKEYSVINKLVNHLAKEQKQQFKKLDEQLSSSNLTLKQDIINYDKKQNKNILEKSRKLSDEIQSEVEKNEIQHHQTQGILSGLSNNIAQLTDKVLSFRKQLQLKIEKNHTQTLSEFNKIDAKQLEYDRQINRLQKANSHLSYRTDNLDESVVQLNKETDKLEIERNNIQQQVIANSEQEKFHFTSVSVFLLIIVVVLSAGFLYTWQDMFDKNQKLITQQMNQDIALNDQNITHHLLQQQVTVQSQTIEQKNTHQQMLTTQVQQLYSDLEKQKKLNKSYQQQLKNQQNKIQTELQIVDSQIQYLNHTVGPYNEFSAGKLEGPLWLNSQNELNVTIELQMFNHMQDIYAFIEEEGYYLKHNLAFYPIKKDDKTQFMLVYGSFDKISQAKLALYDLPYQLSKESKGIASMKDIQLSLL
jgi:chromosome segregation ATPase